MIDVVRDLLKSPLVANVLQAATQPQPQPQPQMQPQNVAISTAQPRPVTSPLPEPDMKSTYINMLLQKARQGSSPELYADYILDNVSEDIIRTHLINPGVLESIEKDYPEVANHREWFNALQSAIIEVLDGINTFENETEESAHVSEPVLSSPIT